MNFAEFLRTPFYIEHLWWLLLNFHYLICVRATFVLYRDNINAFLLIDSTLKKNSRECHIKQINEVSNKLKFESYLLHPISLSLKFIICEIAWCLPMASPPSTPKN